MSKVIGELVYGVTQVALKAWFFMLILGGLHSAYTEVPPLGFWVSLGVVAVASLLFSWPEFDPDK